MALDQVEEGSSIINKERGNDSLIVTDLTALTSGSSCSASALTSSTSIWKNPVLPLPPEPEYNVKHSPMLRKYPSLIPLRRRASSIAEVAILVPSSNSTLRQATVTSATFNMTATIIGGSVLSIPLSCARAGVIPFTILMILSAIMTDFSLYLLCSCARHTGSTSYGRVAGKAVGPILELITTGIIFIMLIFTVVGQMVLNEGIWTPIVVAVINPVARQPEEPGSSPTTPLSTARWQDATILMLLLLIMLPYLLKRDLTSLRHICYVGFLSIVVLCLAVAYRAVEKKLMRTDQLEFQNQVMWFSNSLSSILSALPITLQAFVCSFNMINVHCALVNPTQERVKQVIHKSVFLSLFLMYIFGLAGYLYAYKATDGNILLNFDPSDRIILVGRIGCGITTLFALPINVLPCREALLSLIAQIGEFCARKATPTSRLEEHKHLLVLRAERSRTSSMHSDECETTEPKSKSISDEATSMTHRERRIHWVATVGILSICYVAAIAVPGIAIVWDFSGSSFAFLIQFIIPTVCYIRLKVKVPRGSRGTQHLLQAWVLLVTASVGAVLCTAVTIRQYVA